MTLSSQAVHPQNDDLIHLLHTTFALKDLGRLSYFLGVEVSYPESGGIFLSQSKYIGDILTKTKMHTANAISTPMLSGAIPSAFQGEIFSDLHLYRNMVGALQYVTITRPEIAYSVNKLCQFMHAPKLIHWQAVKRLLRYLKGTITDGLLLTKPKELQLQSYADADWASDTDDRKSTSGLCVYLGSNLITWCSKKQNIISRSSTEAETGV